jgi:hypothetical protein
VADIFVSYSRQDRPRVAPLVAALDLLEPAFEKLRLDAVIWAKTDPDFDLVRDHPRFKAMIAAAEARLTGA